MRVLLQRVNHAHVSVDGSTVGQINRGLLLLTGIHRDDTPETLEKMAEKLVHLRIFPDDRGKFHFSILDINGEALVVSQFTLFGDTKKGRRPDFFDAMPPDPANMLCNQFIDLLRKKGIRLVQSGVFGADMKVLLENEGPVTLMIEV
ncbi:MAG: D-tyrosyl-tRNA(Tyr) deacylase [Bdellovibrionales bacterium]|nr:D-tyrosyl-tRNA(Tyr) deacylase [Bdellovibrionales bacterium]